MSEAPSARPRWTLPPIPAVLLAVVSVQGGAAFAKELFPVLGSAGMAGMRIGLSTLLLFAAFRPPLTRFTRAQWAAVIPYGVVLGTMNLSFYKALERIPLGLAVTLEFLGPLGVAVFGSRRASDFVWVGLAAAGIALIAPWRGDVGSVDTVGVLLALFAGGCWAAYIVLGGRVARVLPGGGSVAAGMLFGAMTVLPFSFAEGLAARLTPSLFAASLAVALLSSAVPYTLEMTALRVLSSRTFGILMSLEPAMAALAGWVFLREQLTGMQWLALVCVSAASAGAALTARRAHLADDEVRSKDERTLLE